MANKKKSFKKVGANILQDGPQSMTDFINDSQVKKTQKSKPDAQMHKTGSVQNKSDSQDLSGMLNVSTPEDLPDVRLHVFIRGYLEKKLLNEVNRRKQDPTIDRKNANKRTVVEEALKKFL